MRIRPTAFFAALLFIALLAVANLASISVLALPERSCSRTLTVVAGDKQFVAGGIDFARNIEVHGTVKVRSCCGFSTNDIDFRIRGDDYGSRGFGVVVGTFSFEWNSGRNDRYEFIFDNEWIVCGGTPFTCARNETSPSYHDKTVELNVIEVAPLTPYVFTILQLWSPVIVVLSVAGGALVIMLLRKRSVRAES